MTPFLEKVAKHYLSEDRSAEGNICIVTPNRRAALFIRSYIGKETSKTMWAPEIISLEEFINKLSGLKIVDNITLLMEFHKALKGQVEGEKGEKAEKATNADTQENFEDILNWAPMLLQDINEVDSNLENPDVLFENLTDIKKMEAWSPDQEPTLFQKQYFNFFKNLPHYHKAFKANLLDQNIAYQGLSHRVAASKIETIVKDLPWQKVIFAGLNALNQAEEEIISTLINNNIATIIWDADEYYVSQSWQGVNHEAGRFIRKYRKKWHLNSIDHTKNYFKEQKKNINVLGIAKNINQVQLTGNILLSQIPKEEHEKTAVVLADETLMTPMLSALPPHVDKVNVTMGYPLSETGFYSFAESVFSMHIRATQTLAEAKQTKSWLYYKDILKILKHPYSNILFTDNEGNNIASLLSNAINKSNRSFYTLEHLIGICKDKESMLMQSLFCNWDNSPAKALDFFKIALQNLDEKYLHSTSEEKSEFSIDLAAFNQFGFLINRFEFYLNTYKQPETLQSFKLIFRHLVSGLRISFSGEPLEGLQIMGMLETRSLDFKNVIIFPVNESILPKGKTQNSFIPYDVKVKYGLNTHKERDAIYAYHFYRLLQQAENIYLIYNTQTGDIGGGEKSRFITQIEHELKEYNPDICINHEIIPVMMDFEAPQTVLSIDKTPDIMEKICREGEKGLSPSSLNIYLKCSLRFYLSKIMNIEESEEVEEIMEYRTMGLAIHDVLEEIFKPYLGKILKEENLNVNHEDIESLLKDRFLYYYSDGDIFTGKNYLLYRVALRMIENYLENERKEIQLQSSKNKYVTVVSLEEFYTSSLSIKSDNDINVKVKGKVDRIDKVDNLYRLIDYKTGKVETKDLKINQWDELLENPETEKSFQLLCYSWLFFKENNKADDLLPSIISFRNPSRGLLKMQHPSSADGMVNHDVIKEFEENVLKPIFQELYDPETPFRQTENEENCKYCPFTVLCKRNP